MSILIGENEPTLSRAVETVPAGRVVERAAHAELPKGEETILLVEDEPMVRSVSRETLEMSGYQVIEAADGPDALRFIESYGGTIHLLLTDVVMPVMSGRELAERLVSSRPEMKVLYMSGYGGGVVVRHGVSEEGTQFLEKPFELSTLALRVREILDQTVPTS
jgi:CheY-like chemotaxis protein